MKTLLLLLAALLLSSCKTESPVPVVGVAAEGNFAIADAITIVRKGDVCLAVLILNKTASVATAMVAVPCEGAR